MGRMRRCRICRQGFWPNPYKGKHQKACDRPECRRELHRLACADWRRRNPDYDQDRRLRKKVRVEETAENLARFSGDPLLAIDQRVVRDLVPLEVAVIVDEYGRLVWNWMRDIALPHLPGIKAENGKLSAPGLRDEVVSQARPP